MVHENSLIQSLDAEKTSCPCNSMPLMLCLHPLNCDMGYWMMVYTRFICLHVCVWNNNCIETHDLMECHSVSTAQGQIWRSGKNDILLLVKHWVEGWARNAMFDNEYKTWQQDLHRWIQHWTKKKLSWSHIHGGRQVHDKAQCSPIPPARKCSDDTNYKLNNKRLQDEYMET